MLSLSPGHLKEVEEILARLRHDVAFVYFTEETHCRHCRQEKALLADLASLAAKLHLETHNFTTDQELADQYGVDKVPGMVLVGQEDYGVRYYGMPSGFEFRPFMEDVVRVSRGESGLSARSKSALGALAAPVRIEVLTQPACPFSSPAIRLAHQLAIESRWITGDVVDLTDFPGLVEKYNILAAPTVVVNEGHRFCGAGGQEEFVAEVVKGAGRSA
ncbi:MAG: protein disulfide oxidoreductase [bacterium]